MSYQGYWQERTVPDFVMLGCRHGDGVMLFASKKLNHAELTNKVLDDNRDYLRVGNFHLPRYRHVLSADMQEYVVVKADSYPEAFQRLFAIWKPENENQELLPVIKELESRE